MAVLLPGHAGRLQTVAQTCCELFCNGAVARPGGVIVICNRRGGHAPINQQKRPVGAAATNATIVNRHEQEVGGIVAILIIDDLPEGLYAIALARDQAQELRLRGLKEPGLDGEIRIFPPQLFFHERLVGRAHRARADTPPGSGPRR
nr:hypothetical protein [Bradyrhizobium sp. WSM2793]